MKYAVITRRAELQMYIPFSHDNNNNNNNNDDMDDVDDVSGSNRYGYVGEDTLTVIPGTLVKVFDRIATRDASGKGSTKMCSSIQVLDFVHHNPIYENLYKCPHSDLRNVGEELWPYVISVAEPERRMRMLQDRDHCNWVMYLKLKDVVSVSGELFGKKSSRYDCIIRYIGPVQELHPVGYFFGLELLHLDSGYSPQSEDIPFAIKYMQCDPSLSIFTTANWIAHISADAKKKLSALDILKDTFGTVRTAIAATGSSICNPAGGGGSGGLSARSGSQRNKAKKPKKKQEASAKFYDIDLPDTENISSISSVEQSSNNTNTTASAPYLTNDTMEQTIQNYERNLERQHAEAAGSVANPNVPHPTGILKHNRRTASISGGKDSTTAASSSSTATATGALTNATTKPPSIMSLEDRDIVVIDKADIRESTRNESNVIVVDKSQQQATQQDVDLADLLGGNWPNTAGDAASILNKPKSMKINQSNNVSGINRGGSSAATATAAAARTGSPIQSQQQQQQQHQSQTTKITDPISTKSNSIGRRNNISDAIASSTSTGGVQLNNVDYDVTTKSAKLTKQQQQQQQSLSSTSSPPALETINFDQCSPLKEIPHMGLSVGSMVEISIPEAAEDLYGVIRWIGVPPGAADLMVGVELEDDQSDKQLFTTDGTFNGVPLFKCPDDRALFVKTDQCAKDRRFVDTTETQGAHAQAPLVSGSKQTNSYAATNSKMFGQVECPSVPGALPPLKALNLEELEEMCGKFKGIQGHHNSCYLDATLFSMFTFTSVFDSLLFRPQEPEDISHYTEVQKVLREEIVNPLRKNVFVRADRVMKLRQLLDKLSSVSGLTSEEKDPEEFLNSLLAQIMRVEPFLKLSSGQDAYFYQLFVEKDERLSFPTVQQLFEQSFHSSDIKLKEVPSCLIIQMPRFGKNYKMYPRIAPSQVLDVTDIIEDSPRQCSVCGKLAEYECRDCFGVLQSGVGLESTAFCLQCLETVHMHRKRSNHSSKKLSVPQDFRIMAEHMTVPRLYMELFAVVCIETSHYVAFVKAGCGPDAPWCFFDSMADRKGEQNGYNIPEMITVPDLPQWLSEDGARTVNETSTNDKMLPEHAKRLFCDAYMCMYQSTDVMMYR